MMYWVLKGILKPILRAVYRIRVEGFEGVPKKGAAIIAANHVSFLDSFFIPLVVDRRKITYLAKDDYFKSWKTAWFFRMAGQIPVNRAGGEKSEAALNTALGVLKDDMLLGIYPEGTRSDGRLHRGRTGVARLALQAGVPVVPAGLIGTDVVFPKNAKFPRILGRIEVRVRFGRPIDTSRYAGKEDDRMALRSLTDEIMYEVMQLSGQEYVDEYASRSATEVLPEPTRLVEDEITLSEEALVG